MSVQIRKYPTSVVAVSEYKGRILLFAMGISCSDKNRGRMTVHRKEANQILASTNGIHKYVEERELQICAGQMVNRNSNLSGKHSDISGDIAPNVSLIYYPEFRLIAAWFHTFLRFDIFPTDLIIAICDKANG
ncbi:hypothetical protein EGR_09876 [Echinococcus granulosus]|uniref:Uncharacterized protein n=1 Tax=Echinococcus granulosus TaxID=6210 RepID=W6U2D6_ECHGR|nr:hypothetical protein EGR_09876 [Echinococcus granulosus]EUB55275.1 hypothetical protein EGR_09876 [Echinococcus granulosus]